MVSDFASELNESEIVIEAGQKRRPRNTKNVETESEPLADNTVKVSKHARQFKKHFAIMARLCSRGDVNSEEYQYSYAIAKIEWAMMSVEERGEFKHTFSF